MTRVMSGASVRRSGTEKYCQATRSIAHGGRPVAALPPNPAQLRPTTPNPYNYILASDVFGIEIYAGDQTRHDVASIRPAWLLIHPSRLTQARVSGARKSAIESYLF